MSRAVEVRYSKKATTASSHFCPAGNSAPNSFRVLRVFAWRKRGYRCLAGLLQYYVYYHDGFLYTTSSWRVRSLTRRRVCWGIFNPGLARWTPAGFSCRVAQSQWGHSPEHAVGKLRVGGSHFEVACQILKLTATYQNIAIKYASKNPIHPLIIIIISSFDPKSPTAFVAKLFRRCDGLFYHIKELGHRCNKPPSSSPHKPT